MAAKELKSAKELKAAIRKAKLVLIQPRFGCTEQWVEISKKSAAAFVASAVGPEDSPESMGLFGSMFGSLEESGELYLG
jgi:hypothetical protein